ncbi:MAG: HAD-IC family P-type ATPase [Coriobacteriia bacterium]|nr:HAD-IC family P-type ATPase [Coriobacteriia bacterium]
MPAYERKQTISTLSHSQSNHDLPDSRDDRGRDGALVNRALPDPRVNRVGSGSREPGSRNGTNGRSGVDGRGQADGRDQAASQAERQAESPAESPQYYVHIDDHGNPYFPDMRSSRRTSRTGGRRSGSSVRARRDFNVSSSSDTNVRRRRDFLLHQDGRSELPILRVAIDHDLPDPRKGLSNEQVQSRVKEGLVNTQEKGLTPSIPQIFLNNFVTLFNLIIVFLGVVVILVGHPENALFLGVAICNTGMGVFQEMRAKRTLDKLSVLAQIQVTVIRNGGKTIKIPQEQLVLDDIVLLTTGDQVCADGVVVTSESIEVDESLLTGESERISKEPGQYMLSGSFITSGRATMQITAVGSDNYANFITAEAKVRQKGKSRLLRLLNLIIKVLSGVIIPMGILLFYSSIIQGETISTAVLGMTAAMIGMIPSGLVLLTGVTLTVGAVSLARRMALVQSLDCIETLARTDVLCLDKTGTITDGSLSFEKMEVQEGFVQSELEQAVSELMGTLSDDNATAQVMRDTFGSTLNWQAVRAVPFSSDRKWSGATYADQGSFILGSPGIVLDGSDPVLDYVDEQATQGLRVMCLAHSNKTIVGQELPSGLRCAALFLLSDTIRPDAHATFKFFAEEGMIIKVISGDNPTTVSAIAARVGIANADKAINMATVNESADLSSIVEEYAVFGHVNPRQKRDLISALQANGHTTCMTGDGVNDILAMRESDSSVAMVSGSNAARNACDFILMSNSFASMVDVLKEGRRVINNIEQVASLYLVSTIFSVILSIIYTFLPQSYPYMPIQMTPVNALTIGIPSFFLALRANYNRPRDRLFANIFEHASPAGITIVFNTLYIQLVGSIFDLSTEETSTMVVFLAGAVGFFLLLRISPPFTVRIIALLASLIAAFLILFFVIGSIFSLDSLISRSVFFYLPLIYISYHAHGVLSKACRSIIERLELARDRRRSLS